MDVNSGIGRVGVPSDTANTLLSKMERLWSPEEQLIVIILLNLLQDEPVGPKVSPVRIPLCPEEKSNLLQSKHGRTRRKNLGICKY